MSDETKTSIVRVPMVQRVEISKDGVNWSAESASYQNAIRDLVDGVPIKVRKWVQDQAVNVTANGTPIGTPQNVGLPYATDEGVLRVMFTSPK